MLCLIQMSSREPRQLLCLHVLVLLPQSMVQFCSQLEAMQSLKEQLEERTRMIEANIQRQQDELRQIQEELQRVQGQSLQVRLKSRPAVAPFTQLVSAGLMRF